MNKLLIPIALIGLVAWSSLYTVSETERAVKLEFGKLTEADIQPGLHYRIPVMEQVQKFDARVLTLDTKAESFYTVEKKRLEVDSFVKWRIKNVEAYYKATGGDQTRAMILLSARVNDGLRNEFATRTLHEVVSGERDQLMAQLTKSLSINVEAGLGLEVLDVRVKGINLPESVSNPVFQRMRTDREKEARQYRSEGKEAAAKIRADAERQKVVIEANAYRDSELVRGDGDASAASIYASAYTQDSEFYSFMRSLNAYKESFASKSDMMLVDPNSDFFRYLKDSKGKK
jgi:membrane protease subunit HflC